MTTTASRRSTGSGLVAGVDEAGRGPLAGPVIAAVVILHPRRRITGLDDSKRLTEARRNELADVIHRRALAWAVGRAEVEEIDRLNIFRATLLAMKRAVDALTVLPVKILVDGTHCPDVDCAAEAVVRGDQTVPSISAASIIAKVARDREMVELDGRYPGYGFAAHKGYSTPHHFDRLRELGVSPIHRRSFSPVRQMLGDYISGEYEKHPGIPADPRPLLETARLKLDT